MPLIEIDRLERHFGPVKAVDGVSFTVEPGMIYGFIGPNGAGKTTTMRILATLDCPTGGDVRVDGRSVVDYPDEVRRLIGFLPDYYGTYASTSVEDYLDFFARAYGLRGAKLRETVEGVISFTGMDGIREKWVDTLSKGMKQRLALGRILVHDPPVLIMDEPTAGLDPRARVEFRELLKVLAERGKAILISSHILTELAEMVHACAIIEKGRLVCRGTVEEVRREAERKSGARMVVRVELLEPDPRAEGALREAPFVLAVRGNGRSFEAELEGDRKGASALLAGLVAKGLPVVQFSVSGSTLEDVFMAVTKGEVQ